eukprot:5328729-Amphidinium_carterae.1
MIPCTFFEPHHNNTIDKANFFQQAISVVYHPTTIWHDSNAAILLRHFSSLFSKTIRCQNSLGSDGLKVRATAGCLQDHLLA